MKKPTEVEQLIEQAAALRKANGDWPFLDAYRRSIERKSIKELKTIVAELTAKRLTS